MDDNASQSISTSATSSSHTGGDVRLPSAGLGGHITAAVSTVSTATGVGTDRATPSSDQNDQNDRRKQIKQIMSDPTLDQKEKSKRIQSLMDGRRRSSYSSHSVCSSDGGDGAGGSQITGSNYVTSMARAAAIAAEYYSSDDDDATMSDGGDDPFATTAVGGGSGGIRGRRRRSFTTSSSAHSVSNANDDDDDYYTHRSGVTDNSNDQHAIVSTDNLSYGYDWSDSRSFSSDDGINNCNNNYNTYNTNHNNVINNTSTAGLHEQSQQNRSTAIPVGPGSGGNTNYRQYHGRSMSLQDWKDTDRAAAAVHTTDFLEDPRLVSRLMELSRPPCPHYERNCTKISPCCGLAFGCRICHDECPVLPPPLWLSASRRKGATTTTTSAMALSGSSHHPQERRRSMPLDFTEVEEETHHLIDRFAVREVICRECYERQSSKTNQCIKCGIQFGEYHCSICNLWMSAQEHPYHCDQCGFCRVGGRENFTHCDMCGMCIDTQLFDDHNCKSGKYMSNCPICQEDLFSSRFASHEMPCGHAIHWHCFKELTSYDTRCPVCKKTAESFEQMQPTWSAIAMGIALQPVPPDMARCVSITCNDCEVYDANRRWHFLGVRCTNCLSFNTVVERILLQGQEAADFLDEYEAQHNTQQVVNGIPSSITATISQSNPNILQNTNDASNSDSNDINSDSMDDVNDY